MWMLRVSEEGVIAELDVRGQRLRAMKEAMIAMLILVIGFSIISLPDELLTKNDAITPLGRLAWHSVLGFLAALAVVITRWNRRATWVATPQGLWFNEESTDVADLPAASISSVTLDDRPLRRRRLLVNTVSGKQFVLCRGFGPDQDPQRMSEKLSQWYNH